MVAAVAGASPGERLRISLNTYWNFLPCDSADRTIPPDNAAWGYFIVPGYWRSSGLGEAMRSADGRAVRKFNGRLVTDYPAAWYRRTFNPPASMKGKKVQLYFELFYSNPEVYINGRKVPVPSSFTPRYQVPVDSFLKYGEENTIHIRAEIQGSKYVKRGGIRGNLWLEARPEQNFGEPAVTTSLRKRQISVEFLRSVLKEGCGTLSGAIRDAADGKTVHAVRFKNRDSVCDAETLESGLSRALLSGPERQGAGRKCAGCEKYPVRIPGVPGGGRKVSFE